MIFVALIGMLQRKQESYSLKIFREEREQTLFVLFDISGSENFGNEVDNKLLIGTEIASILAFSALKNNDKIGLATFTDKIERYFKPQKGRKHILSMIRYLLMHKGGNEKTQIREALKYIQNTIKRRSIIILISDFLDDHYERTLINLNRYHEVILIRLYHPNELFQASSGTIPVIEIESGHRKWLNAGDIGYRKQLQANFAELDEKLLSLCKRNGIGYITINTQEDYIPALAQFFKKRNRNRKS